MSYVKPVAWMHDVVDSDGGDPDLALSFYEDSFPFCDIGFRSVKANPLYSQETVTALQAEIEAMRKDAERSAIAVARMELIIDMCNADEEVCDEFQGVAELIAFKCQVSLDDMKDECAVDLLDAAIAKEKQPCADSK